MDFDSHTISKKQFRTRFSFNPSVDLIRKDGKTRTFKALDQTSGENVLLNVYQGNQIGHTLFLSEAEKTLKYDHQNLLKNLDFLIVEDHQQNFFGESQSLLVSVQEYFEYESLDSWMMGEPSSCFEATSSSR